MRNIFTLATCLTPLCFTLAACSGAASTDVPKAPKFAAHLYILNDVSGTSAVQGDDVVGKAVRSRIGEAVKALALGDSSTIVEVGSLSAERFVTHPTITTTAQLRQAAAARKVVAQMEDIAVKNRASGGDGGTHLTMALANLQPDCRSGRSVIMIVSDGLEQSHTYSAVAALNAGKPIALPPPSSGASLKNCKIAFLGFGMATDSSGQAALLPEVHLSALRKGWEQWLSAAGVAPADMTFTSLL
jgi:hypothetical protein